MTWVITRDRLAERWTLEGDRDVVSVVGVGQWGAEGDDSPPPSGAELDGPGWRTFRLYDDDGEHYYDGRYDQAAEDDDDAWGGLAQAWRWGMFDSGATDLRIIGPDGSWQGVYA